MELAAIVETLLHQNPDSGHHKNPDKNMCYETGPEMSTGAENTTKNAQQKTSPNSDPNTGL